MERSEAVACACVMPPTLPGRVTGSITSALVETRRREVEMCRRHLTNPDGETEMNLIRLALVADAAATAATGALLAIGGSLLADLTGLPATATLPLGLFLVAYAAFVGWAGMQR